MLLVIDDAQYLTLKAMEVIRVIHENAGIGIVFCGNQYVYDRMFGREATQYSQLFSRIGIKKYVSATIPMEDVKEILKDYDISKDCMAFLHKLANSRAGLTYMLKIYRMAEMAARTKNESLNVSHLTMTHKIHSGK